MEDKNKICNTDRDRLCSTYKGRVKPFSMLITKTGAEALRNWVLFGFNRFHDSVNFGSNAGITITVAGASYIELLNESNDFPFKIKKWSFITDNTLNLGQVLTATCRDANGNTFAKDIVLLESFDVMQGINYKIDVNFDTIVDGRFYIQGRIALNSYILVLAYPEVMVDNSKLIVCPEGDVLDHFDEPMLSRWLEFQKLKRDGK